MINLLSRHENSWFGSHPTLRTLHSDMSTKCRVDVVASYRGPERQIISVTASREPGKRQNAFAQSAADFQDGAVYRDFFNSGHVQRELQTSLMCPFFKLVSDCTHYKDEMNATLPARRVLLPLSTSLKDSQAVNLHWTSRTYQVLFRTVSHLNRKSDLEELAAYHTVAEKQSQG